MKKLLLPFLIFTGFANAQIVNVTDPVFKAKLLSANSSNSIASTQSSNSPTSFVKIDTNNDGQIQVSEALVIKYLNVAGTFVNPTNITSMNGIASFLNLQYLYCGYNHLTSLNVTQNLSLYELGCQSNAFNSLDVTHNTNLQFLDCDNDYQLTSIDVTHNLNLQVLICNGNLLTGINLVNNLYLQTLNCSDNNIISLDVTHNTNLINFNCSSNELTNINILNNTSLVTFNCQYNALTSIDVTHNTNLTTLECSSNQLNSLDVTNNNLLSRLSCNINQLTSLDVTHNLAISKLSCGNNQLTNLNISNNANLIELYCGNNQLTGLDVTHNINLQQLGCYNNQLTSLDVTHNLNLQRLDCFFNQLTSLDLTNNITLFVLQCDNNQLNTVFIKNGIIENEISFGLNPNLIYICADEAQIANIQSQVGPNVMVSSYCSFVLGGIYNTVTGTARFDVNNNGCDSNDVVFPNSVHFNISDGTVSSGTFSTTNGSYLLYTLTGNNVLTSSLENPSYFTITPATTTITTTTLGNTQTQDFCISANGVHNDVELVIVPVRWARPGFDAEYKIVYKNKGNQTLSGAINFNYNDAVLDYVSSSLNPNTQSTGNLAWNYTNLLPFESRSFNVVLNVNAPTETPAVNIGDVLNFNATINPISGDETTADNVFTYNQTVVGAFDPNDKTCLEGAIVSPTKIGDYLHYNINFENTGNAAAENIVVKDIIDTTKFDVNSLQIMNSSHAMTTKMSGNKVEFVFQNINLGASQHGNVAFKLKTKNTLVTGNTVTNKADIYFDYNFPVATNTATTTFQTLSSGEFTLDNSVKVYPNPSNSKVNINANSNIKSMQLFDVQGRILTTKIVDDSISNFDISTYSNGVYFVKIITEKGSKVEKVIKE